MKALRQLGFLKLNLRQDIPLEEDHRVLALFRNRAELKKAYGDLQEETFRLKDLIKQQEGATQRVQEMLNALEGRLGVAESAYPALVFYQLRRLWQTGREMVAAFVADLARQQDERERRTHLAQHNREQFARRQELEGELQAAQALQAEATAAKAPGSPVPSRVRSHRPVPASPRPPNRHRRARPALHRCAARAHGDESSARSA